MTYEDAVVAICDRTGKTREQAEAFLALLGSAFARRGWVTGPVLDESQIGERIDVFLEGGPT
jgi:hypothetical protein